MPHRYPESFICIDCETTGLDAEQDRIIEIAALCFSPGANYDGYETLIDPECAIPESSVQIHHITQDMVKGKPKIQDVLEELIKLIGDRIIVGHGIQFDIQLIVNAAKRHNIPCNIQNNPFLDTLRMARLYGECPVNSLEQLRRHFNVEPEGAHRAMSDVVVNIEVFRHLFKFYKNVDELFQSLSKPILFKIMPLGKHKGRLLKEIPLEYLLWAAHKDFDDDLLYSLRAEIKRRKSGNLFSQAANPFAQL